MVDLQPLSRLSIEAILLPVLVQLIAIVLAARLFAAAARRVGQPSVVGEIFAGIVLGPSLFGALFPDAFQFVFRPQLEGVAPALADETLRRIFGVLSQVGLILLLFLIGADFDFFHLKSGGKAALAISVSGIVLPFAIAFGLAYVIHPALEPHPVKGAIDPFGFALFLGVAFSITALPVLGRIMSELNIMRTRLGAIVIGAAAIGDAVGWILLASVAATVHAAFSLSQATTMVAATIAFGLAMIFIVRPLALRWLNWAAKANGGELGTAALGVLLALVMVCAAITNVIGIFAIFGAFLLGAILSDSEPLRRATDRGFRDLVTALFMPIFFTYTGLRTDIGTLHGGQMWLICIVVIALATIGKFVGCALAARWCGFSGRESGIVGSMMNARGLMELIVVNVGYDLGVIPKSIFCILVLMALVTNLMTTPIVMRLMRGTELEPHIRESGFVMR